ncbi:hypothetical protein [Chryseobacterium pennipullorum]|uniref:Uncharacterized protein n=1 Tax=Chryseobacterium pennipullorum TaxID=2258963 RepID=A0A3D9B9D5_9FLAO|nr:hypothetical protein [Chryseobacterium pennipullorum]REC50331.1 hypothetical protein DRF67_02035 [Chryseobacterium pennipullorum]
MENNKMELKTSDIREFIKTLLVKLDNLDIAISFTLDEDVYWNILDEELYDAYKDPVGLTMGSLADDWSFLQAVLKGKREIVDYDLYKLAAILRFLGKKKIITKAQNQNTI